MRGSKKTLGTPERIIEVSAVSFELRRETTVDNGDAA
jgi:hypothetical protein